MLISIRTLINTTIFWIVLFLWFWLYTKYDETPAKNLLHAIGWDALGNIEIITEQAQKDTTIESLSTQLIAERLTNLEEICSKSIRLSLTEQDLRPTSIVQPNIIQPTTTPIVETGQTQRNIPIINNSTLLPNISNL
jgi:hypothetical protein